MPDLVTAALIAAPLIAGGSSGLGVSFSVAPGWHIYWENPGDTGIPTTVDFQLPEQFSVGSVHYPGPEMFTMPGDLSNYGYDGEVALLADLTAPSTLPTDGEITAKVRWLVCRAEQCVPGQATLTLPLAALPDSDQTSDWRAALPMPLPDTARQSSDGLTTTIILPQAQAGMVFPDIALEGVLSTSSVTPGADGLQVTLTLSSPAPEGAGAVLRVEQSAGVAHYQVVLGGA